MSQDWPTRRVQDLQADGVILVEDGNHGEYRPRRHEFVAVGTAFIRAADMSHGTINFDSAEKINDVALQRIRKGIGAGGDIVFSHKGTVGKLAIAPPDAPPFVCSPQTTFWRVLDCQRLDRGFLYSYMRSRQFRDQWFARKGETDMADYVSLTAQRQLRVACPPIEEQRAVASILGALDDKIDLNREMNRTLEAMAQALFNSWFVDFDPVVAKAAGRAAVGMDAETGALFPDRFVESELGPIPEGWEWATIADLAEFVNGRNFTKNASGAGRMVIRIAELNGGPGGSTVYNDVQTTPKHIAEPGDILFAWSGSLGIYTWYRGPALINQHIFKVVCEQFPLWFVHQHLLEALPTFRGIAADKATTMGHIKRSHLSEVEVAMPRNEVLATSTTLFEPLYQLILDNELETATLMSLRDTLLPELLSGKIRLQDAGERVAEAV